EMKSYHSPGTCTFYGTANTNQVMLEVMGLQLPGSSFVSPYTPLRNELTAEAARQVTRLARDNGNYLPLSRIGDEKCIVNAVVALLASGGSTNHALHIPAIARAAGILLDWQDMAELSAVVPTLAGLSPSGSGDVPRFPAACGTPVLIATRLEAGLRQRDVDPILGAPLDAWCPEPYLETQTLELDWRPAVSASLDENILR